MQAAAHQQEEIQVDKKKKQRTSRETKVEALACMSQPSEVSQKPRMNARFCLFCQGSFELS